MLIGEYLHTIDAKKRLAIPSKLRRKIGEKAILTRGLDGCLFLFSSAEWAIFAEKLSRLSLVKQEAREFARLFLSGAVEAELDQLGRVLVPAYLKKYARLEKRVIIAGMLNRLEIWDQDRWEKHKNNLEEQADKIAEKLGELGVI